MGALIPDSANERFILDREPLYRGKVRDTYDAGEGKLLIVATDRISAYDVIMPNLIPGKGKILNSLSKFWFEKFGDRYPNHFITSDTEQYPEWFYPYAKGLQGRSMLVQKTQVIPFECVARGYLAGSGWKEYQKSQTVCGIKLPPGLKQCSQLPEVIFTPATKEEDGHDQNISFEEMESRLGDSSLAKLLKARTVNLYSLAARYAANRGVIIADTKFEFGRLPDGKLILIDEVLTPDSSRFWPKDEYEPGHDQPSFDKQFVRNYLEAQPWGKTPPAPPLPAEVVHGTYSRYVDAYEKLTGKKYKVVQ